MTYPRELRAKVMLISARVLLTLERTSPITFRLAIISWIKNPPATRSSCSAVLHLCIVIARHGVLLAG
ncbi:hypothetical protein [Bradyrhizobium sp. JYMT SZCCT0428]|uniref:hypothetical protein n=1 Tax=Bradyrhizobium sp. JYMT SZCCT0428 TaxID=2807673 RepID=UPI001BA5458E|nr:hypothetical protein [Bradyrhizobium sp. JYMT SZCCT0428]